MNVRLHPHAIERSLERGATCEEVEATMRAGAHFPARHGRTGFRQSFDHRALWRGRWCARTESEASAVEAPDGWRVITVIVRVFGEAG